MYLVWLLAVSSLLLLNGCKKATDPQPADENELITTVTLRFTEQGTSSTQAFTFQDKDGDGGAAPTKFDSVTLTANRSYSLTVEVLDESKTPVQNITDEIREQKDEHLFVFTANAATLLTYTYGDLDSRNFPIGLTGSVRTGGSGTGQLKVRLRHQPPINGVAVKNGTASPGSDDVNLDFALTVR
jgi:hypothetical protein